MDFHRTYGGVGAGASSVEAGFGTKTSSSFSRARPMVASALGVQLAAFAHASPIACLIAVATAQPIPASPCADGCS